MDFTKLSFLEGDLQSIDYLSYYKKFPLWMLKAEAYSKIKCEKFIQKVYLHRDRNIIPYHFCYYFNIIF